MATTPITIPSGFTLHTENTASLLLPEKTDAFLNPVQEFNRDLSVACITVWSEEHSRSKERSWLEKQKKADAKLANKRRKVEDETTSETRVEDIESAHKKFIPYRFTLLEALSATGLRSIRYAKEIPLLRHVIANDLSSAAVAAIKRNVEINGLGPQSESAQSTPSDNPGKVRVSEADACSLMYSLRTEKNRVDVVDLDPYGTAAPFIDGAVQCVSDGGLVCVTCTDMSVLATTNFPEKCFANYGGVPVKAEYCHEAALRLVLHTLSTSAARYGRYIHPLLSLSIDFYVRLFIRVHTAPVEVKKLSSTTATFYICSGCQSSYAQPLGKVIEKVNEQSGNTNLLYRIHTGPPVSLSCDECGSPLHIAGPMWSGPIHDTEFVAKVLDHVENAEGKYGTSPRMKGMLTLAQEEIPTHFYFTPARVSSFFHCVSPPLDSVLSALLHAGHCVSRSHACAGSIKTSASREVVHDIFRCWVKSHPVKSENIKDGSPAAVLLSKEPKIEANWAYHASVAAAKSSKVKIVRYQQNPAPNWGPGARPNKKRKSGADADDGSDT